MISYIGHQRQRQPKKKKIDKLDFMKMKKFCASKDTINRITRKAMKWEKIFGNHISDKELISRIFRTENS